MKFLLKLLAALSLASNVSLAETAFDLQHAIDNAQPADKIMVPSDHYFGTFVIAKPLTLEGVGDVILDGQGKGTVVFVTAPDVTLTNLAVLNSGDSIGGENAGVHAENAPRFKMQNISIENTLFGIRVMASPDTLIDNCHIIGKNFDLGRRGDGIKVWYSPRTQIRGSSVRNSRDILIWYSDHSIVEGSQIQGNRYGLHYMYSHNNLTVNNLIRHNSVGIYNMYSNALTVQGNVITNNRGNSGYGFAIKESNQLTLVNNRILNNRVGVHFDNSPLNKPETVAEETVVNGNLIAYNDVGVNFIGPGEWVQIYNNDFYQNWQQVRSDGARSLLSKWRENFWSDYTGFDLEKDGYGNVAYRSISIVDRLLDRNSALQVYRFSPAILAVEFAERAVPWLMEKPRFEDPKPAMHMHAALSLSSRTGIQLPMLMVGFLLLGFAMVLTRLMKI